MMGTQVNSNIDLSWLESSKSSTIPYGNLGVGYSSYSLNPSLRVAFI